MRPSARPVPQRSPRPAPGLSLRPSGAPFPRKLFPWKLSPQNQMCRSPRSDSQPVIRSLLPPLPLFLLRCPPPPAVLPPERSPRFPVLLRTGRSPLPLSPDTACSPLPPSPDRMRAPRLPAAPYPAPRLSARHGWKTRLLHPRPAPDCPQPRYYRLLPSPR